MDHHFVTEPAAKMREIARHAARGNWWRLFLGLLISIGLIFAASFLTGIINEFLPMYRYIVIDGKYIFLNFTGILTLPLYWVLLAPMYLGICMFMIKAFRTRQVSYGRIFAGYKSFFKALGLLLLVFLKIFAWSLLLIVPGIIAMFRYSMAMFLLADNPDWKITQCINESKRLMKGNKGKLFCLCISFIGWILLWYLFMAVLMIIFVTASIIVFQAMTYHEYLIFLSMFVIFIPIILISIIPLASYMYMAVTVFYELVTGNLVVTKEQEQISQGLQDNVP